MKFEWDEEKQSMNLEKHRLDFAKAYQCWESPMLIKEDKRRAYGEPRWVGLGLLAGRVVVVVFTLRSFDTIRLISFRKANHREVMTYEKYSSIN